MRALVTGAAGFIGSHLCERLVGSGAEVTGIDALTDYYSPAVKRDNLAALHDVDRFSLVQADLCDADLRPLVADADVVFHLAGQPGVRRSWANEFDLYLRNNVLATQRILEASLGADVGRFVYASSSSVYGEVDEMPTVEDHPTIPHSPYGVTKLAAEHLVRAYAANHDLHTVALRYFTVYGPRQRPDMAIHRLINAARTGEPFTVFGDGSQLRDYIYIDDIVTVTEAAATADVAPGTVVNAAGGSSVSLADLIEIVGDAVSVRVPVRWEVVRPGDVYQTGGSIERAKDWFRWAPEVPVDRGVRLAVSSFGDGVPPEA